MKDLDLKFLAVAALVMLVTAAAYAGAVGDRHARAGEAGSHREYRAPVTATNLSKFRAYP